MNRLQFWILNIAGVVLVVLLLAHFALARWNGRLRNELARDQAFINNARQVEPVLDQMAKRIAKGSETDPRLRDILVKYGLSVTLEAQGKKTTYP